MPDTAEQSLETGRTLQFDTPHPTPSVTNDTPETSAGQARARGPDYQTMFELMRQDLADLRETQRHEHSLLLASQTRCQELEALTTNLVRSSEANFFTPTANTQVPFTRSPGGTVVPDPTAPSILHIPIRLNPAELETAGPPPALTRVAEPATLPPASPARSLYRTTRGKNGKN